MENERILILGGAGSLGTELVKRFVDLNELFVFSRDEAKHWELKNRFAGRDTLRTIVGDIRDAARVRDVVRKTEPSIVIHAAALKQVDTCELFPGESVDTNVAGTRHLLAALEEAGGSRRPKTVCFVSTDKACNPINVYGMCKSISEKLVLRAADENRGVKFVVTRYGNVLSSKGSVIPLFEAQARDPNQPFLTVTLEEMTRFMMTLEESVTLINSAILSGRSGDLWVPRLDSMRIGDLAAYFSRRCGKGVRRIGVRPGEKIHEVLLSQEEASIAKTVGDSFVVSRGSPVTRVVEEYSSKDHVVPPDLLAQRLDAFLGAGDAGRAPDAAPPAATPALRAT